MPYNPHIATLIDAAANQQLAILYYRKGSMSAPMMPRTVEPYHFAHGRESVLIRCYQISFGDDPQEGWRCFMSHKIESVHPTTHRFKPRRTITLPTGEVHRHTPTPRKPAKPAQPVDPADYWDDGRRAYRDALGDALADGELTAGEAFDLEGIKQRHKLKSEDVRFVHADLYHHSLGCVLEDGFVSASEQEQIRLLDEALNRMGWSIGT